MLAKSSNANYATQWVNQSDGGSGNVYVTTVGATLPEDLAEGTLIARYTASGPANPVVTAAGTATSSATGSTIAVTTTATIPVGDVIAVAINRGNATAATSGSAVVTLSAGAVSGWTRGSAARSSTHDTALVVARVTTAIPSGSTVTITTSTNTTSRAVAMVAGINGVSSGTPDATSGDAAAGHPGNENHGPNGGNTTSATAATSGATTETYTLVLGAFGAGNSAYTVTQGAGQTQIGYAYTEVGSSDRGLVLAYKVATTTGTQSMSLTLSTTGSYAGVVMALPLEVV